MSSHGSCHRDRDELGLLIEEFSARRKRGEPATIVEEYLRDYPHLATELRVILPTLEFVERATSGNRPGGRTLALVGQIIGEYQIVRELGRGQDGRRHQRLQDLLSTLGKFARSFPAPSRLRRCSGDRSARVWAAA